VQLWSLGTGSRGNAVLVDSDGTRFLIDAGFPMRELASRLAAIQVPCESVDAALVTHEHLDHVRGACAAARRWGWTLYATTGTIGAYPALRAQGARQIIPGVPVELPGVSVHGIRISHDAAEPVAFVATSRSTGARAAVAYDLGAVTGTLRRALERVDVLLLEANHDDEMLRASDYPESVRRRIAGARGHLSNRAAAALAAECAHADLAHLVLTHLSDSCNEPQAAVRAVAGAIATTRFRGRLAAAPQAAVSGPFGPGGRRRSSVQLTLGF
jgi:phosphoribosyl 1,2-cyclic phosphodiesterase